jgi:hypothetical protein
LQTLNTTGTIKPKAKSTVQKLHSKVGFFIAQELQRQEKLKCKPFVPHLASLGGLSLFV